MLKKDIDLSSIGFYLNPRVNKQRRESSPTGEDLVRWCLRLLIGALSIDQLQTKTLYLFISTSTYIPHDQYELAGHSVVKKKKKVESISMKV